MPYGKKGGYGPKDGMGPYVSYPGRAKGKGANKQTGKMAKERTESVRGYEIPRGPSKKSYNKPFTGKSMKQAPKKRMRY